MLLEGVDLKSLTASLLRKWDVDELAENVYLELVDEITLGIGFEVHRSVKTGLFPLLESDSDALSPSEPKKMGLDVFGSIVTTTVGVPTLKKQPECVCPNCSRNLAASRFAPHLEKCMGMGRNSSRIASRRIASSSAAGGGGGNSNSNSSNSNSSSSHSNNNSSSNSGGGSGGHSNTKEPSVSSSSEAGGNGGVCLEENDDAEDEDWIEPGKSFNRKKRDKNSPRRNRAPKYGNAQGRLELISQFADGTITPPSSYDHLSKEERVHLLANICGVISHSKRVCTRSTRCQIHNDSQRREVRIKWLGGGMDEETHVDIDSFTEGDTAALRESLSLLSNASSPAESTISNSSNPGNSRDSSSSRRSAKGANRRTKRGKGGSKSGSRASTPPNLD